RALYDTTQAICASAGLPAYEISNHARPGAECRHNLVYWRAQEYAGIGPGAHGRLDVAGVRRAPATERRPESWLMRVESVGHGVVSDEALTREQMANEFLLMGLRLAEGIDPARYARLAGRPLDPRRIALLREQGAVETTASGMLRLTLAGFPVLDAVVADLAAGGRLGRRAAETLRRRADDLAPGRRHPQHGEPALVGAIGTEAEQPVDTGEARGIGQHLVREALLALGLDQRRNQRDGIVGERGGAHGIAAVAASVAGGEIAKAGRIRPRIPRAVERRIGEDLCVFPQTGPEQLHAFGVDAVVGERLHHHGHGVGPVRNEDGVGAARRLRDVTHRALHLR